VDSATENAEILGEKIQAGKRKSAIAISSEIFCLPDSSLHPGVTHLLSLEHTPAIEVPPYNSTAPTDGGDSSDGHQFPMPRHRFFCRRISFPAHARCPNLALTARRSPTATVAVVWPTAFGVCSGKKEVCATIHVYPPPHHTRLTARASPHLSIVPRTRRWLQLAKTLQRIFNGRIWLAAGRCRDRRLDRELRTGERVFRPWLNLPDTARKPTALGDFQQDLCARARIHSG